MARGVKRERENEREWLAGMGVDLVTMGHLFSYSVKSILCTNKL